MNARIITTIAMGLVLLISRLSLSAVISQNDFLKYLTKTHPLFQKEKLSVEIAAKDRESHLSEEDWNLGASLFFSHEAPAVAFSGPERTDAFQFTASMDRLFWKTGGNFSASITSTRADLKDNPLLGIPDVYYENKMSVAYVHPLKKNRNGFLNKFEYELKQFNIDLADIRSKENQEEFLTEQAASFLDWVFLDEQQKILKARLLISEEHLENTRKKRKANLIDEVDVIRSEDAVRNVQQNLLLIQANWKAVQKELAMLSSNNEMLTSEPVYDIYQTLPLIPLNEAQELLEGESRILQTLALETDRLQFVKSGFTEQTKPDLALVVQANLKSAKTDFGSSLGFDKPDAQIGLQLGFPVGHRKAKTNYAKADLQILQLEKTIDDVRLSLTSTLASIHTRLTELTAVLQLNQEQIESAILKTKQELKLYNQGRGELTFVIQSRDNEQAASLTYVANAITYHKLLLQYYSITDQLLGKYVLEGE